MKFASALLIQTSKPRKKERKKNEIHNYRSVINVKARQKDGNE